MDITPTPPIVGGGYLGGRLLTAVSERLEANLAVLRLEADSAPVVMISVDLLYPGRILRAALEAALPELRPDQIFLAASHTHQAPLTDDTKALLGAPDAPYLEMLAQSLSREVRRMLDPDQTQNGTLFTGTGPARHSVNRRFTRRFALVRRPPGRRLPAHVGVAFNTTLMGPNPGGVTDEVLTVLISRSDSGRAQCVVWNYACHPVSFPDKTQVAADFPHQVRTALRASLGVSDLPVLFLQGFSGDTRPSVTANARTGMRSRLRGLFFGPWFTETTRRAHVSWATELGELVAVVCGKATRLGDVGLSSKRHLAPASSFVDGAAEPQVSFHAIRIGPDFAVVGASAEVVAEFARPVRSMAGSLQVMCVGCLDHTFGYAPTDRLRDEGGYEGGDYCELFGLGGLTENIEEQMRQGFESVL